MNSRATSRLIGIDLGTTSSRVAAMYNGEPVIIENSEGEGTTPSHVAANVPGQPLVGEAARRYALQSPESVAFAVKRLIGRRFSDPLVHRIARFMPYRIIKSANGEAWVELNGRPFSPSQISAFTLLKMKQTAEQFLGETVTQAVITVPASFLDSQRQATKDACRIAGIEALRIVSEPVAAALYYGFGKPERHQKIAVYDLGGGTFDISILDIGDGVFDVKSTNGDSFLGGEDIDYVIAEYLARRFELKHGIDLLKDPLCQQRLKTAAETAKIELSSSQIARIELPFIHFRETTSYHLSEILTRAELDVLLAPFVERTIGACKKALEDADLMPPEINAVVLVGGSTRIPLVQKKLKEYFMKAPLGGLRREDAVALGAMIYASILDGKTKDVLLLDVISHSIGVRTEGDVFTRLIDRNSTIPTKKSIFVSTSEDDQTEVSIKVFQGESEKATDNKFLGKFNFAGIPPLKRGVPRIEVTLSIDADGILEVSARGKGTRNDRSIRIQPSGGLTESEINEMSRDAKLTDISSADLTQPARLDVTPAALVREDASEPPPRRMPSSALKVDRPNPTRPRIFVSYAHEDLAYVRGIEKVLSLLIRGNKIELWVDRQIKTGEEWENGIFSAIEGSNIAILLLSNDFLSSEFIAAKELPAIFAEKERRRLALIPILVRPCPFELHDNLAKFQLFNNPEAPFASLKDWELEGELLRLAREISKGI